MSDIDYAYGFTWGPVTVERVSCVERPNGTYRVLRITSAHGEAMDLYISPAGRSIRAFRGGVELKAAPDGRA